MRRVRIGIIGAGALTEWAVLPALSGPDALTPPDTGAWWGRRPGAHTEIHYQPPAQPDVVAICDADEARARRVADAARVRAVYTDWRQMLRELQLDALFLAAGPDVAAEVIWASRSEPGPRHIWVDGPPAPTSQAASDLEKVLASVAGRGLHLWCARPLRQAQAHRAARRLLERGAIGPVSGLSLRWGAGLFRPRRQMNGAIRALTRDESVSIASGYAAADLLLAFASPATKEEGGWLSSAAPVAMVGSEKRGVATLWLHFADGTGATMLFAPAENWSSPLPRLEICGTEGRSLVCEGGRRLWLHEPRESARMLEPPGLVAQVSAANLVGIAEDIKAFLAACSAPRPVNEQRPTMETAIRALRVLEAAAQALSGGGIVEVEPSGPRPAADEDELAASAPSVATTLPLDWSS